MSDTEQLSQATQPGRPPRKWPRQVATGAALVVALGVGIGIGSAGKTTTTVTKTVTVTSPSPSPVVQTVTVSPPPPPAGTTLLDFSGTGDQATRYFTVGGNGDYTVSWTFSGNTNPSFGSASNFIVSEDDSKDANFNGPNVIQSSGSGSTDVTNDAGTHSFNVQATGSWTIKVVSAP